MDEQNSQAREAFLAEVEESFQRGAFETVLAVSELRLKQFPRDLDARVAICRVRIQQGKEKVEEARDMLRETEDLLADLGLVDASPGGLSLKKGLAEEDRSYSQKHLHPNPGGTALHEGTLTVGDSAQADQPAEEAPLSAEREGVGLPDEEVEAVLADFQTVTLAELYIRQGHLAQAKEVLEAILRQDPSQAKAAEKLLEVRTRLSGEAAIAELSLWLKRLERRER